MATYVGYNTIDQIKKFQLTDTELVKRDLLNSLNIRQGEVPGRPEVGTTLWSFIFEPNTDDTIRKIRLEIQRLVDQDPRISIENINISTKGQSVLIEISARIHPNVSLDTINILFDENRPTAIISS